MTLHAVTLGLLVLLGLSCSSKPRSVGSGALATAAWIGEGRRLAQRAATPGTALTVEVPPTATRALIHVTALTDSGWPWPTAAEGRVLAEQAEGELVELASASLTPAKRESAGWHAFDVEVPAGTRSLRLEADAGDALEIWWSDPHWETAAKDPRRNVLLVSLDTLRADAVSHLGQVIESTPHLDALADEGTTWTRAQAPSSWTLPSHASALTGVLPSWHGRSSGASLGAPTRPTLATRLREAGYETVAFTGEGFISWSYGPTRGFDLVVEHSHTKARRWHRPNPSVECWRSAHAVSRWLKQRHDRSARSPFFMFWHSYEPHDPYTDQRFLGSTAALPDGVPEAVRDEWLHYIGDIAAVDEAFGAILSTLEELGLRETTDILVFSDHGEEFGEHSGGVVGKGHRHGHGSWQTLLHVPLVADIASVAPGRRDELVTLLDIFPTVLAIAGLDDPGGQGRQLQVPGGHERVYSEAINAQFKPHEEKTVLASSGLKYRARLSSPPERGLWDWSSDPLERTDLANARPEDLERLEKELATLFGSAPPETAVKAAVGTTLPKGLPPAVAESLKSLGYTD
ncbi:MAG: sulfatase [Acidobacteriota bacterium]